MKRYVFNFFLEFSGDGFSILADRIRERPGVSGRVPYYFSRVPVADMIPTKEAHTPRLREFRVYRGVWGSILFSWPGGRKYHHS